MDKMQAKKIRRQLLALDDALLKTFAATFELDKEEQRLFRKPVGDLRSGLHFEMLEFVYGRSIQNCVRLPSPPPSAVICGGKT